MKKKDILRDGVGFVKCSGIKYPHPDYDAYTGKVWQNFYISGNELKKKVAFGTGAHINGVELLFL